MHVASYLLKLSIDYVSLGGCGHTCPGMSKETFKILSQKLMGLYNWGCGCDFISIKATNW